VEVQNDSISIRLVDVDLRLAIQSLARVLDRPVVFGNIGDYRVSFETPQPVSKAVAPKLLEGILQSFGLELRQEGDYYAVGSTTPTPPPAASLESQPVQLFAIQIRHARAADVAATISALYGQPGAMGEIGAQGTTGVQANSGGQLPPVGDTAGSAQPAPLVGRIAQLTGEVRIVPDPRTNSLLVRATREDFQLIEATVQQLDIRPLQVLIEVVIAEVRRDRSLALGVGAEASSPPGKSTGDGEWSASTPDPGLGDLVIKMLQFGKVDLAATLRAAASRGDVSILSRPVVLAANNEPAEIVVGSQRPFVQVQRSLPTDAPVRDQVVQFKDVGTRLSVTPTVSQDGYVMLEVTQEVSAATAEVAFDAPVISTRSIRTHLLVKDGHTAVMGGLGDRQHEVTRSGVPVLSSIPLLGALFGTHSTRTTETELFVFLTPRVIRTDQELDQVSDSVGNRTKSLRK
jgi:general secretion pathway protein D